MQQFYRDVDENININKTFSIDDISEEYRLHRFYIIGEDVTIENILEDSEILMENSDKIIDRLDTVVSSAQQDTEIQDVAESQPNITFLPIDEDNVETA